MLKTLCYPPQQTLSYAEYGAPGGFPVLVQHGLIASIQDACLFQRLLDWGARLICIARPGYGESSPYVMKNVAEWGQVVAALVEDLRLARFDVLGISSGAPYSYAIARRFPERVRRVYIFSGTPALFDERVQAHWPYPLNPDAQIPELQALAKDLFFSDLSEEDLRSPDVRDSLRNDCFGLAQDLRIRCRDWGFRLAEVTSPVSMRHSRADDAVPLVTAQLTAGLLPNCHLDVREAGPHFSAGLVDDFIQAAMTGGFQQG